MAFEAGRGLRQLQLQLARDARVNKADAGFAGIVEKPLGRIGAGGL
jgi:hypothetical protein